MIAVDTNILVYAHRRDAEFHAKASECIQELAEGSAPWSIPWPCLHEFYSVVTHPRIYSPPSTSEQAIKQIQTWLVSPSLTLLSEEAGHWTVLKELIEHGQIRGPMIHDARIAALCITGGIRELWTVDRDFSRFVNLRKRNPLH